MMIGWQFLTHSWAAKSVVALVLIASLMAIPLPQGIAFWQGLAEAAPPTQTPPGQLKRRGIVGEVVSITTSSSTSTATTIDPNAISTLPTLSDTIMIVKTKWGDVEIIITGDTSIKSPLQGTIDLEDTVGSKVAVLADKSPSSSSGNATSTVATLRTVTALKVMVVPGKAVRTHARAVVKGKIKNKLQLVDDDGNEIEVEDQDAPENENELEEGDEVILVIQVLDDEAEPDEDGDGSNGKRTKKAKFLVRSLRSSIHISERLERITDALLEESDSPRMQRLKDRIVTFQDRQQERLDKVEERLGKLSDRETPGKKRRKAKLNNLLDRIEDAVDTLVASDEEGDDERPRDRVKRIRSEVKERVKGGVTKIKERIKGEREERDASIAETDDEDGDEGRRPGPARRIIGRIVDAVTDANVAEASDTVHCERRALPIELYPHCVRSIRLYHVEGD